MPVDRTVNAGRDVEGKFVRVDRAERRFRAAVADRELDVWLEGTADGLGRETGPEEEAVERSVAAMHDGVAHIETDVELGLVKHVVVAAEDYSAEGLRCDAFTEERERPGVGR